MEKPLLIAIGGFSGSGKTSAAEALQKRLPNAEHLDSDRVRKALFGVAETTRLPPEAYTTEATRRVISEMERRMALNIAEGKNVIVSALFSPAVSRHEVEKLANKTGARFVGIWLGADLNVLLSRVKKRTGGLSDANAEILKAQAEAENGTIAWPLVDAALAPEDVIAAALRIVGE